jgi:drug/metabolite transporter (DMT)-like permease
VSGGRADVLLLLTNVVYGTGYLAQRVALDGVPPALLGLIRLALGSVVLLPALRGRSGPPAARGDGPRIFWMGVLGFGVAYVLSHAGMQHSTATSASLLITVEPVALVALSRLVLGERLRRREAAGAALVLAGALLVVLDGVPGLTVALFPRWRGDVLLILSALAFASYSVIGRDVLERRDPPTVTAHSIAWGAASMAPVALLEWVAGARPAVTPGSAAAVLYLAVVVTGLAYLAWNHALARVPAPRAAIFINVQPVVGVALGVGLLGEPATVHTAIGAGLVVAGLAVTTIGARPDAA